MRLGLLALPLLLAACDRRGDPDIEPVPPPSEGAANRLMSTAEQAAAEAQAQMEREGSADRSAVPIDNQGDSR